MHKRITINHLALLSHKHDLQALVAIAVERDGTVTVVSYGEDRKKCKAIGDWAQGLWKYAVALDPFQRFFGWGNGGVPKDPTPSTATEPHAVHAPSAQ